MEQCKNVQDSHEPTHSVLLLEITGDMRRRQSLPRKVIRFLCNQEYCWPGSISIWVIKGCLWRGLTFLLHKPKLAKTAFSSCYLLLQKCISCSTISPSNNVSARQTYSLRFCHGLCGFRWCKNRQLSPQSNTVLSFRLSSFFWSFQMIGLESRTVKHFTCQKKLDLYFILMQSGWYLNIIYL